MADYIRCLEAGCRSLPEVVTGIIFFVRRRSVDLRQAEQMLKEFGVSQETIQNQHELLKDLVDFERIKRDWDGVLLMCILSYVVLAFTASPIILFSGIAVWIIAFALVRSALNEDVPGGRYRGRRLLTIVVGVMLITSTAGKIATVYWGSNKPSPPAKTAQIYRNTLGRNW